MAVMNAQYKHPSSQYSQGLRDLIDATLKVDPQQRPDIHQVSRIVVWYSETNALFPPLGDRNDGQVATTVKLIRLSVALHSRTSHLTENTCHLFTHLASHSFYLIIYFGSV